VTRHEPALSSGDSETILIIKLGALGDVVLCLPQVAHILEAHPDARVTLLTAPGYGGLLAGFPRLQVACFRRKGLPEMLRLLAWLLRRSFDVVYDLQGSRRSRIMTLFTRAPRRVGRCAGVAYTHGPPSGEAALHAFDRFNAVLVAGGIGAAAPVFPLSWFAATAPAVTAWVQENGLHGKHLILLHAGSSRRWRSKRWEEEAFLELAIRLKARGYAVVWTGAEADRDLNRRLAAVAGVDATGRFDYPELVVLARYATFALANDSGPMHLFSMAGLPVYAFFGPTDWRRSHALGQAGRVLTTPLPCSPCLLPVCPPQLGHACLREITPAMVIERLEADGLLSAETSEVGGMK
jgi:ADP-heptose:LPS heptosyltransferase